MQRKITANELLNFLNQALDEYEIRRNFEMSLGQCPGPVNTNGVNFIITDEQRKEVQDQAFILACAIPINPNSADAMVDGIMKKLQLSVIPIKNLIPESTSTTDKRARDKSATLFSEPSVDTVKKSKKVEIEVTDDMTIRDLFTQLTGRKPGL